MAKVLDNRCPGCNAPVTLDPTTNLFICKYCDRESTLEELNSNASKAEINTNEEERVEYNMYNCPDCGASVVCDENTSATFCVYCGNTNIIVSRLEGKFAPSLIIPFKKDKDEAKDALIGLRKGRPFIPDAFLDPKNIDKITGVYIPFWLYDVSVSGDAIIDGSRVSSWTVGNTRYTKTDKYEFKRAGKFSFDRIPVDGSNKFPNDIMNSIEPFDYNEFIKYNHAYLSGFLADKYDVDDKEAFKDCEKRSLKSAENQMLESVIANSKSIRSKNLVTNIENTEYVLLPVWMVNIKFQDQFYTFAMNGQTGKFVGNIPIDKKKVKKYVITRFLIVFIIAFIISYIFYCIGGA